MLVSTEQPEQTVKIYKERNGLHFFSLSLSLSKSPSKFNRIWYTEDTNENALIKCFYLPFSNMSCGYGTVTDQCHTILFHGIIMFLISETKSLKCYFSPEEKGTTLTRNKKCLSSFSEEYIFYWLFFVCPLWAVPAFFDVSSIRHSDLSKTNLLILSSQGHVYQVLYLNVSVSFSMAL